MKTARVMWAGLVLVLALAFVLHGQLTGSGVPSGTVSLSVTNIRSLASLSDAQLEELLRVLAATPMIAAEDLPHGGRGGNYLSLAHPGWPPLPGDVWRLPVWDLGSGFYLINDLDYPNTGGSTLALNAAAESGMLALDGGGGGAFSFPFQMFTTNDLWLEMAGVTNTGPNQTAGLVIHPPWNVSAGVYDLFATTNLAPGIWQWGLRCASGQTNLIVTNLAGPTEFFILGLTNDADGDFLSDAYELLVSHTDPDVFNGYILTQPQSQVAFVGDTVSLSVAAVDAVPTHYQWRWNGVNLGGATNATLTLSTVQLSQSGNYSVIVSNACGSTNSFMAALRVWQPGVVTLAEAGCPTRVVNLSNVVAITSGGMSQTNLALKADGTVVMWSVTNFYTITNRFPVYMYDFDVFATIVPTGLSNVVAIAEAYLDYDDGILSCYALKSDGTVTAWGSDYADLFQSAPYQGSNIIAIAASGENWITLFNDGTVDIYASEPLTNVVGVAANRDWTPVTLKDDGTVWSRDEYGDINPVAGLTNIIGIAAGEYYSMAIRSNRTVVAWGDNSSGQCDVPAGLTDVLSLSSAIGNIAGVGGTPMPYTHSTALKMDGMLVSWGWNVPVAGSNYVAIAPGASDDGAGDWAIYGAPQITEQPASQPVCLESLVALHVGVAAGSPVTSFQWRKNGVDLPDGGNISGVTNAILTLASVTAADAGNYTVVLMNEGGAVTSAPAFLTVAACTAPMITTQPQSQSVSVGAAATFTVTVTGPGPLSYQWRKNGSPVFNGGNISGANSSALVIQPVSTADRASYDVVISNPAGSVTSDAAALRVCQPGVDTDGDGLPDDIDAEPENPDTTAPAFVITAPLEGAVF